MSINEMWWGMRRRLAKITVLCWMIVVGGCTTETPTIGEDGQIQGGDPRLAGFLQEMNRIRQENKGKPLDFTASIGPGVSAVAYSDRLPLVPGIPESHFSLIISGLTAEPPGGGLLAILTVINRADGNWEIRSYHWNTEKKAWERIQVPEAIRLVKIPKSELQRMQGNN